MFSPSRKNLTCVHLSSLSAVGGVFLYDDTIFILSCDYMKNPPIVFAVSLW